MDDSLLELYWGTLSKSEREGIWESLDSVEKAYVWKNMAPEEKDLISEITDESLNRLAARARSLPEEPDNLELLRGQEREGSENGGDTEYDAKFELKRIHREKIEKELQALRDSFSDYAESSETRAEKGRTENVYILVALGIIGGYFSINPSLALESLYQKIGMGFAAISGAFILIKVNTVRVAGTVQQSSIEKFDNWVDVGYSAIITGIFVLSTSFVTISLLGLELEDVSPIITGILGSIATILQGFYTYKRLESESESKPKEVKDTIIDRLFEIPESDNPDEKINEIIELSETLYSSGGLISDLKDVKNKAGKIGGISDQKREDLIDSMDQLTQEKEQEQKSEEELRAERMSELEERRKEYRKQVRNKDS